jgi:excisionase family DNA binding protein
MKVIEALDEVMNYRGLSEYLKLAQGTLRKKVMRGEIPYYKIGHSVRFSKKRIDKWLEGQKRELEGKQVGNLNGGAEQCARTGEGVDETNVTRRAPEKCNTKRNDVGGEV